MIRKFESLEKEIKKNMRGGKGEIEIQKFLKADEFHGKGRLFGKIIVRPGMSIGLHQHVGDCETFFVLKGEGMYNDNGNMVKVEAGEVLYVDNEQSHSIENTGKEDLELIALILFV